MQDHPLLGHLALGYSAVIDRQRNVVATRLTVFPETPDAEVDGAALWQVLGEVWPESGSAISMRLRPMDGKGPGGPGALAGTSLLVNPAGEALLHALLVAPAVPRFMIEVPTFIAADRAHADAIAALRSAGGVLALKGPLREPLTPSLAHAFALHLVDDNVPAKAGALPRARIGVRGAAELDAALAAGMTAATGWPLPDVPDQPSGKKAAAPELQVILELINRVDREESIDRLEAVLKNDPTLAFRLLRYINSAAFGLRVEIASFRHALMMLGYQKLKRWLALLLASASKDANMKPVMHAAVRRGLIMEELARPGGDADMRGEIFICGVFSLLDRLLRQPFSELLRSVPVPERVHQALVGGEGPFLPFLELVQAIESESVFDIRECAGRLMLGPAEVNRALLTALHTASTLD